MSEVEEVFLSGFCKRQNRIRRVLCELEDRMDEGQRLLYADCDYEICEHGRACLLMRQLQND